MQSFYSCDSASILHSRHVRNTLESRELRQPQSCIPRQKSMPSSSLSSSLSDSLETCAQLPVSLPGCLAMIGKKSLFASDRRHRKHISGILLVDSKEPRACHRESKITA